jgi:hypothetical protein
LVYSTRGERLNYEKKEGDRIYNIFKEELETNDKGKIVAIDIDAKEIIAKNYDANKVLLEIRNGGSSGRIHIRRVSKDRIIDIETY